MTGTRAEKGHTIVVGKLASSPTAFLRPALQYRSARAAISAFLRAAGSLPGDRVLCPAYVGWSPREGSGVLDPLKSLGLEPRFYRMRSDLSVDLDDLGDRLERDHPRGVIVIHYFGRVDPCYVEMVRLIKAAGAWCLEDEAHALFTDLVSGACGRLGDAAVLSLHKVLPVSDGGALLLNPSSSIEATGLDGPSVSSSILWDHDLQQIAATRQRNSAQLAALIAPLAGQIDPLWTDLPEDTVLQTYPVILRTANRDQVYEEMNALGQGVVSLYHTLVSGISETDHPESHALSRSILNLPIHQDVDGTQLAVMVRQLARVVGRQSGSRIRIE